MVLASLDPHYGELDESGSFIEIMDTALKKRRYHIPYSQGCGSGFIFLSGSGSGSRRVKKCKEIANNCNFIKCLKENLHKLHCFLLLSNLLCFLQLKKTIHDFFFKFG